MSDYVPKSQRKSVTVKSYSCKRCGFILNIRPGRPTPAKCEKCGGELVLFSKSKVKKTSKRFRDIARKRGEFQR